jgi:hypothetical protein
MTYSKELIDKFNPKEFILQNTAMFTPDRDIIHIEGKFAGSCQLCDTLESTTEVSYQNESNGLIKHFKAIVCQDCLRTEGWIEWMKDNKVTFIKTL